MKTLIAAIALTVAFPAIASQAQGKGMDCCEGKNKEGTPMKCCAEAMKSGKKMGCCDKAKG